MLACWLAGWLAVCLSVCLIKLSLLSLLHYLNLHDIAGIEPKEMKIVPLSLIYLSPLKISFSIYLLSYHSSSLPRREQSLIKALRLFNHCVYAEFFGDHFVTFFCQAFCKLALVK